ncbi:MAG: formiminotransferase-cyclodeaminase [Euryarchaeota archaeon]|nr:formiminotransferase-cyclodeaminase [Euryarchaeota archaeon]
MITLNDGYRDVLDSISSSAPTPGGGSVAGLTLAHAHALTIMVARLTVKSEKWIDGHDIANKIIESEDANLGFSIRLAQNDALAFDEVMNAYRLPKDTDAMTKKKAITEATIGAASAPLEILDYACILLKTISTLVPNCNVNALTDLASASELALASAKIAAYNVKINTQYLEGDAKSDLDEKCVHKLNQCNNTIIEINSIFTNRLGW